MSQVWTKERLDVLRAYLEGGLSYSEIAIKFKTNNDNIQKVVKRNNLGKYIKKQELPILDLKELDDVNFEELKEAAKLKWVVPKSKVPANKKKPFKTYIVVGDIHAPEQDDLALNTVYKLMSDVKFDGIVNIGDFMDMNYISRFSKGKNKSLEGKRIKNDYIVGNAILDVFDKLLPQGAEKYFLHGNHEARIDAFINEWPMLDGLFDISSCLRLSERGYKVFGHNEIVKFGRLSVLHGLYCGANPAKTHANKLLTNVLFGHLHSPEMALIHSPAKEISVVAYCNGCLCRLAPEYMINKPSNWAQGVAILYVFPDNQFDVHLLRIVKNKLVYNGKIYDGSK
jgi:predicted phosphodiesterase/predicted DNA-binding protein YlxM (UPF0122 family)